MLDYKIAIIGLLISLDTSNIYAQQGIPTDHTRRHSSYPYISGDTFRAICNHHIDETNQPFIPESVQKGDIIFVRGYSQFLDVFLLHLPHIKSNFILLSHNNDQTMPGHYSFLLEDPRLIAWFTQNKGPINHPKLIGLPIGIANAYWNHGNIDVLSRAIKKAATTPKTHLLYVNFKRNTNIQARDHVLQYFKKKSFCSLVSPKPWPDYLNDLASSHFILSPPGNGMDCHRAWEALLMGSIPVMKSTSIDSLFDELPVVIVQDWKQVTKEFLQLKYKEIKQKSYKMNRLYADYWLNKIKVTQAYAKKTT